MGVACIGMAYVVVACISCGPYSYGLYSYIAHAAEKELRKRWNSAAMVFSYNYHHWLHHSKFNYNFGGFPWWDIICGTRWVPGRDSGIDVTCNARGSRAEVALDQAAQAGMEQVLSLSINYKS